MIVILFFILFLLSVHAIVIQIPLSSSSHNVNFDATTCSGSDNFSITIINPTLRVTVPDDKYISNTTNSITVCPQANLDMSVDYNVNINSYSGYYSRDYIDPYLLERCGTYCAVLVYGNRSDPKIIHNANVNVIFTSAAQVSPSSYTASTTTSLNLETKFYFEPQTNLVYNNRPLCTRNYKSQNITTLNYNLAIYVINNLNIGASIQKITGPTLDGDYFWYTIKITNTGNIPFKVTNIRPDRGSIIQIEPNILILNQVINPNQSVEFRVKTTQETGVLYFDLNSDRPYCGTTITSTLQLGLDPSFRCNINPNPIEILNQSGASSSTSIDCGGSPCDSVSFSPISELSIRHTGYTIDVTLNRVVNRPSDVVRINATRGSSRYSCELNINYYNNNANNSTLQCTIDPNPIWILNQSGASSSTSIDCGGSYCLNINFTSVPRYLRPQLISRSNILIQMIGTASNSRDTISINAIDQNNSYYRCNLTIIYSNLTNPCRSRI
jgi:hypothetical protein